MKPASFLPALFLNPVVGKFSSLQLRAVDVLPSSQFITKVLNAAVKCTVKKALPETRPPPRFSLPSVFIGPRVRRAYFSPWRELEF